MEGRATGTGPQDGAKRSRKRPARRETPPALCFTNFVNCIQGNKPLTATKTAITNEAMAKTLTS